MTTASTGRCPRTSSSAKNGASRTILARPLMRSVSLRPGISAMIPTCGFDRMLRYPSARLLPGRSAIAMVRGSSTWMSCPAGSPLGEASQLPSASDVASTQNGDLRSHSICSGCSAGRSLVAARPDGNPPSAARSSSSEVIWVSADALLGNAHPHNLVNVWMEAFSDSSDGGPMIFRSGLPTTSSSLSS